MTDHNQMGLFESQVRQKIKVLQQEIEELKKDIRPTVQKIRANSTKVDSLLKYLALSGNHQEREGGDRPKYRRTRSPSSADGRTVGDVAVKVLEQHGRQIHYRRLMDKMEVQEGFKVGGQNPQGNMLAHLANDNRVIRVGKGIYSLKKWREGEKAVE